MKKALLVSSLILFVSCFSNIQGVSPNSSEEDTNPSSDFNCGATSLSSLANLPNVNTKDGQSAYSTGNFAYIGTTGSAPIGIQIVDISTPGTPVNRGFFLTSSGSGQINGSNFDVLDVYVEGNTLLYTVFSGGIGVVDVSDPDNPVFQSKIDYTGETWAVAKKGDTIYVGNNGVGINVIDASNLSAISHSQVIGTDTIRDMKIIDDKLYTSSSRYIRVYDISTPANPVLSGTFDSGSSTGFAYEIAVKGNYIYAANLLNNRLDTYDISALPSISLVDSTASVTNSVRSIDINENKVYIGTGSASVGNLHVYDITNAADPAYENSIAATQRIYDLSFNQGKVITANRGADTQVFKVCTN